MKTKVFLLLGICEMTVGVCKEKEEQCERCHLECEAARRPYFSGSDFFYTLNEINIAFNLNPGTLLF